jgi:nitroimidazol reductase NimA-like FMN-containing flavoprotein (pyridoxamine 5'-phosphate oxidase superfamily)/RimJ/RimL family protein N-acetyltransferase
MRRKDKEITDRSAIDAIIRGSDVCHLALALDSQPYLVPMSFGYDGRAIYLHSAPEGRKIEHFEGNNQVCFEFERVGTLLRPEGKVCGWTVPFQSVIGQGTICELVEPEHKLYGLNQIVLHYGGQAGQPDEGTMARTRVWKIVIHSLTGKRSKESLGPSPPAEPKVKPRQHTLQDGRILRIREAEAEDALGVLEHIHAASRESGFLNMGPGEFELGEAEEAKFLRRCQASDNQLYLLGLVEGAIVATLTFSGGRRRRVRHWGEFGMSVRKEYWGLGMGSLMVDALLDWARGTGIVTKINLRVRTDNERAICLYERKGFVREGTIRKAVFVDGQHYDHHCMGLEL